MSYANSGYWQDRANACKQYADEGACLARVSRHVPVTIEPGFGGLGQIGSLSTLAARSADLVALQTALMNAGALSIRTADGVISSSSSQTLLAVRAWATSHGLSATGTARTAGGGLTIPTTLLASILGSSAPAETSVTKSAPTDAPASAVLPGFAVDAAMPRWLPWVAGGAAVLAMGAFLMGAGTGARVTANVRKANRRSPTYVKQQPLAKTKKRVIGRDVTYVLPPPVSDSEFKRWFGFERKKRSS